MTVPAPRAVRTASEAASVDGAVVRGECYARCYGGSGDAVTVVRLVRLTVLRPAASLSGEEIRRLSRTASTGASRSRCRVASLRGDTERRPGRPRARAARGLLRDQPRTCVGRGRRALRQPAQRLLAAPPRRRLHAAAARPAGAVRAARARLRRHERGLPHDAGLGRPAPRRLRRLAERLRGSPPSCGRARSRSSARRPTAARSASGRSSGCRRARSATRPSSCCRRRRPRTPRCRTPSACAGSPRSRLGSTRRAREAVRVSCSTPTNASCSRASSSRAGRSGATPGGGSTGRADEPRCARARGGGRARRLRPGPLVWTRSRTGRASTRAGTASASGRTPCAAASTGAASARGVARKRVDLRYGPFRSWVERRRFARTLPEIVAALDRDPAPAAPLASANVVAVAELSRRGQEIVDAARELVEREGSAALTMRAVAARSACPRPRSTSTCPGRTSSRSTSSMSPSAPVALARAARGLEGIAHAYRRSARPPAPVPALRSSPAASERLELAAAPPLLAAWAAPAARGRDDVHARHGRSGARRPLRPTRTWRGVARASRLPSADADRNRRLVFRIECDSRVCHSVAGNANQCAARGRHPRGSWVGADGRSTPVPMRRFLAGAPERRPRLRSPSRWPRLRDPPASAGGRLLRPGGRGH